MSLLAFFFLDVVGSPVLWASFVVYLLLNVNGKKLVFLEVPFGVNSAHSSKSLLTLSKYVLFRMAGIVLGVLNACDCEKSFSVAARFPNCWKMKNSNLVIDCR